ncbi:hypothetical protein NIES4072_61510 [Nostoc commune NIES-4072]|uniref:Uncharacterized protein n=1 Tax=Nostoc commune NIES-4072 TaxID=2005467 RepID=A0A2R5FUK7_NOSCO|nr:hypothetical protein NIES4070_29450 [Nostoc commune HK-02]GBG22440.1 hypothetical protein NIES4072_61510 [Nostoc commune NIES-4072]
MGVLVFLGQGLRISMIATRNFTCKPLLRFSQDILQYIKLYSDALKYEFDEATNGFSVYATTVIILLFSEAKDRFLYFILGFPVCMYIYVSKYSYRS